MAEDSRQVSAECKVTPEMVSRAMEYLRDNYSGVMAPDIGDMPTGIIEDIIRSALGRRPLLKDGQ